MTSCAEVTFFAFSVAVPDEGVIISGMYSFNREEYEKRIVWFREARFGLFVHYGLYSIPAMGEWLRSNEEVPPEDYEHYISDFTAEHCDPAAWVRMAARAGMKYAVLTAKHHDGFCLFDSALTDFTSIHAPAHRDIVREFVEACRKEGLRPGIYYSLIDWHHEDYPHYGDMIHPMRNHSECGNSGRDFNRYLEYMHGQIRELLTGYGKIDLLFLDYSYGPMKGEKWKAEELVTMIRSLQPGILINNRLETGGTGFGSLVTSAPLPWHGDYVTPEQIIPPDGIRDEEGRPVLWESCVTMNRHWAYHREDHFFKSGKTLVRKLVECVSKGGNMILNVGPDAFGRFPDESVRILETFAHWMDRYSRSIYCCGRSDLPKPEFGRFTKCGNHIYFHVLENTIGAIPVQGIDRKRVKRIRSLSHGHELPIVTHFTYGDYPDVIFVDMGPSTMLEDDIDTVLDIELVD